MGTLIDKLNKIKDTKERLKSTLESMGVIFSDSDTFSSYPDKINETEGIRYYNTRINNGQHFSFAFHGCSFLTSIPQLDTSKCTDFTYTFGSCNKLTSIPQIDTSKGTIFSHMFNGCSKLTSIPQLDVSKGTAFNNMFASCVELTSIPQLDVSKGVSFGSMFSGCNKLTTVPELDTSKGSNFGSMFYNCTSLVTIEGLDFSGYISSNVIYPFGQCNALANLTVNGTINSSFRVDSTALTHDSLMSIINALSNEPITSVLTIGNTNIAKLTEDEKNIAINKGWTLK